MNHVTWEAPSDKAKCYSCGKYFDSGKDDWYSLHKHHDIHSWIICSPSCLTELAWGQKESQPKLSKSTLAPLWGPDPWAGPNWVGKRLDE